MEENSDDETLQPSAKKIKAEWCNHFFSNKAMQMMKKMGYDEKKGGLGKKNQGIIEPIIAVQQEGRSGLGHKVEEDLTNQWDPNREEIEIPEKVDWIENKESCNLTTEDLKYWLRTDNKKLSINDEDHFVDPNVLRQILESKSLFDQLTDNDLRKARSRANPFETIRNSIFLNRAAVKMANIDSMCQFMFSEPKDKEGNSLVKSHELLYFADICAGPGGFSEYILYRKSWCAKGFGFTLKGANDFKLDKFFAGSAESFDPFYGAAGDGDVFVEANQDSLAEYIFKHCEGVHFVMADGGFSVEGQENIQEILSKQLYLCQCLTALKILRPNGNFVCKLFDIFTPFSVGLIYLMYKCFHQIAIIKPNSSRPANSERYLVCKWKLADPHVTEICNYLNYINRLLNEGDNENDIQEIVDMDVLREDNEFFHYITESNNKIGRNQIVGLQKIAAFCKNAQLKEMRQMEFRKRCLEAWNLPDKLRQPPENKSMESLLENILGTWYDAKATLLNSRALELKSVETLQKHVESIYDWWFIPIGRGETSLNTCSIFLCRSKGNLLRYTDNKKWEPVDHIFEISPKSLFYGEICYEYSGEGRTQIRISGLHIIDAIMLGGIDIRRKRLSERLELCRKYSLSVNKPFKENKCPPIRSKPMYKLQDLDKFFNKMRLYTLKDASSRLGFLLESENRFFVPGGIMMFCEIFQNFYSVMSKSRKMLYYFDKTKKISHYEDGMPNEVRSSLYASFRNSFMRRIAWKWSNTIQVKEDSDNEEKDRNLLYRDEFQKFLFQKTMDSRQQ